MIRNLKDIIYRSVALIFALVSLSGSVSAQSYSLRNYTTTDGLPHNNVRNMITDKSGYLWISTWDGLTRFDGYEFRNYHHIPGDSLSLPFFSVSKVEMDYNNDLWVQTDNGSMARFNRRTEVFTRIDSLNGEYLGLVKNISADENERIWIICDTTIFIYEPVKSKFNRYSVRFPGKTGSLIAGTMFNVTHEAGDIWWLGGSTSFRLKLNETSGFMDVTGIYPVIIPPLPPEKVIVNFDHSYWYRVMFDVEGRTWLSSGLGFFLLDEEGKCFRAYNGEIPVRELSKGNILGWGDLNGGIHLYIPRTGTILDIPVNNVGMLKNLCASGEDIIWYSGTSYNGNPLGLSRIILTPNWFRKYTDLTPDDNLPAVFSITTDRDRNVWLGIRGRNYIPVFTPYGKVTKKFTEASSMPGYYGPIRSIKRTREGLWLGYYRDLLLFYNYSTGTFKRYDPGRFLFRALEARDDGKLYIGNSNIILYDPATGKQDIIHDSIPAGGNFRFRLATDGTLWSGTPFGVVLKYSPIENKVSRYQTSNHLNNIEDVCPGDSNNIWLAILGGGLVRYNTATGLSRTYTTSDGMSNNTVYSILRDRNGYIWASTDNGISRLNPETGIIKTFGSSEGLDIKEFNSGASFIDDDGKFWFGGMGGAVRFDPDSIDNSPVTKLTNKIILTGMTVSGKRKVLAKSLNMTDTIILEKGENNFHLSYAVSDFVNSDKTIYRYRLSDQNKDWLVTDNFNRNINYSHLDPGSYTLTIEATGRDGEWKTTREIHLILKPKFTQTALFKILLILLIFGISHIIFSIYMMYYRGKVRMVQDELRLRALRGQMNPHFIFNSLNSINYFISNNDRRSANRYIADFSRLIRSILSNMDSDYVSFTGELGSIRDYLEIEHLRFGDKFNYEIETGVIKNLEETEVFPGLIQPFVENAIWHGVRALEKRKGTIRIAFSMDDENKLLCVVEDDGIGRKRSHEIKGENDRHASKGIEIVQQRLHIIGKLRKTEYRLTIDDLYNDRIEAGTRVKIEIPYRLKA